MELLQHFHTRSQSFAHIFKIWLFLILSLALFRQEDLATLKRILQFRSAWRQFVVVGDTANIDFDTIPSTFSSIPLFRYFFRYRYLSLISGNKVHHTINKFVPQQLIVFKLITNNAMRTFVFDHGSTLVPPFNVDAIFQHEKRKTNFEKTKGKNHGKEPSEELHVKLNISHIWSSIENIDILRKNRYYLLNCEYRRYRYFGSGIAHHYQFVNANYKKYL